MFQVAVDGAGEHQAGVSRDVTPGKGIFVLLDLFPDDVPGDFGNAGIASLLQLFE